MNAASHVFVAGISMRVHVSIVGSLRLGLSADDVPGLVQIAHQMLMRIGKPSRMPH